MEKSTRRLNSRSAAFALAAFVLIAVPACDGLEAPTTTGDAVEEFSITVDADRSRILEKEEEIEARQQTVQEEKKSLDRARREIADRLSNLSQADRKQRSSLEQEEKKLLAEERQLAGRISDFERERSKLEKEKTRLLEQIAATGKRSGGASVEQREATVAGRERALARREAELAEREKEIGAKEREALALLQQARELLTGLDGTSKTIVVNRTVAAGANKRPTASAVRSSERKVRSVMRRKGILKADLSPAARELERAAERAEKGQDYEEAANAYDQLLTAVNSIAVNKEFVQAKFGRINREVGSKKLGAKSKQINRLLNDVSGYFTDGRYESANRKINEIYALMQ